MGGPLSVLRQFWLEAVAEAVVLQLVARAQELPFFRNALASASMFSRNVVVPNAG